MLINAAKIKALVKQEGKRTGKDFLDGLDILVKNVVLKVVREHNGGKKTVDVVVLRWIAGKLLS